MMSTRSSIGRFLGIDWFKTTYTKSDAIVFISFWVVGFPIFYTTSFENLNIFLRLFANLYLVTIYTAGSWFIVNILFPTFLTEKKLYSLSLWLVVIVLVIYPISSLVVGLFYGGEKFNLSWLGLIYESANNFQNILMLVALLIGKKFFEQQRHTLKLESERRQAELQRLRAQVDPHFLFNSLNILDILIEDDPSTARAFVHRLSNLYRYLIRHRDEDLVPAADEMQHARDYNFLVEQRFGGAFHFRENFEPAKLEKAYIPPGSLQTVLENVYKHNLATERNPVTVTIECKDDALYVINDYSPKPGELATHETSGSGTANLLRRYALLTDEETYSRQQGAHWMARLPLLFLEEGSSTAAIAVKEKV